MFTLTTPTGRVYTGDAQHRGDTEQAAAMAGVSWHAMTDALNARNPTIGYCTLAYPN